MRQTRRRNRKMKIVSKTRFALSMTLILVFVLSTSMIAFANFDSDTPVKAETQHNYTVQAGDTLWSISSNFNRTHYNQEKDVRKIIYTIRKMNDIEGNTIYTGQELNLPF
jgi:cell division protein YceG involved in septum cleavage